MILSDRRLSISWVPWFVSIALGAGLGVACSRSLDVTISGSIVQEQAGLRWQGGSFLEPEELHPSYDALGLTHRSFDAFVSGSDVWLVMSVHERTSTDFAGYARRYRPGSGWGKPGQYFKRIAPVPDAANRVGLGEVVVGGGSASGALVVFAQVSPAPSTSPSPEPWVYSGLTGVEFSGATWASPIASPLPAPTAAAFAVFQGPQTRMPGSLMSVARESTGRAWVVGPFKGEAEAEAVVWNPGLGFSSGTTVGNGALGSTVPTWTMGANTPFPSCQIIHDGNSRLHLFYAPDTTETRQLNLAQLPLPLPSVVTTANRETMKSLFSSPAETIGSTAASIGHSIDTATNGAGEVWAVTLGEPDPEEFDVVARRVTNGTWGSNVTVSSHLGLGWKVVGPAPTASPTGVPFSRQRPSIAYLGQGRYLTAFVAHRASVPESAVFSSLYDPAFGWSTPAMVDQAYTSVEGRPAIESVVVFANGRGGAGIAFHVLERQDPDTTDGVDLDTRRLRVGRYRVGSGWGDFESAERTCSPGDAAQAPWEARRSACSNRPVGALLPSGEAVVVHPVSDGYLIRLRSMHFW